MYTEAQMKKALGAKRWEKVQDFDYSGSVIDIAFKLPWTNPGHGTTTWVCEPGYYDMTKKDVVTELKYFIDEMVCDWDVCPYDSNGNIKEVK